MHQTLGVSLTDSANHGGQRDSGALRRDEQISRFVPSERKLIRVRLHRVEEGHQAKHSREDLKMSPMRGAWDGEDVHNP